MLNMSTSMEILRGPSFEAQQKGCQKSSGFTTPYRKIVQTLLGAFTKNK